jgi:hypothetical protein
VLPATDTMAAGDAMPPDHVRLVRDGFAQVRPIAGTADLP